MWEKEDQKLVREFTFNSFAAALAFIQEVGLLAEAHRHHPTIINTHSQVRLELTTHDADHTLTGKDYALAEAIDSLEATDPASSRRQ